MLVLRPYQSESIDGLRQGMRHGHKRQILCASTGAGKSVIMLDMIRAAMEKGSHVLFAVDRRILVDQFSDHLDSQGIDHGVLMAKHWRWRPDRLIQIASIQTLERMKMYPQFDVIFIDEIHAMMRKSVINILERFNEVRVVGATATPFHPMLSTHFSNIVNVITMSELVEQKHLVPFRVFIAHEIDTKGVPVLAGEWKKDELEDRARMIVGDVVSDYVKLSNEVFGEYRKTICFSAGVAHGAELAEKFNSIGIKAIQISYKDTDEYKDEVLKEFAKPDTDIQIVISSDILTRGFDQTDVHHIIVARPVKKSFSLHVQMVGRGARPHGGKEFCLIQDHAGNWLRFADDWDVLYHDGVKALKECPDEKTRKEPEEIVKEKCKCPRCKAVWIGRGDVCANCGYVRPNQSMVGAVPGEMAELNGLGPKKKEKEYSPAMKQQWYSELLHVEFSRFKKPGYAYACFIDKFDHKPHGYAKTMKEPGIEVLNWIKHKNIAYAKAKNKGERRVA